MNLLRRYRDDRHWLDKARYNYPLVIAVCLLLWYVVKETPWGMR